VKDAGIKPDARIADSMRAAEKNEFHAEHYKGSRRGSSFDNPDRAAQKIEKVHSQEIKTQTKMIPRRENQMKNMTTLGKVSERVNNLSKDCPDNVVKVEDISFDGLETVRIANEPHLLRPIAQQSAACRLGIPINYLRKCPPEVQAYNMNHWMAACFIVRDLCVLG